MAKKSKPSLKTKPVRYPKAKNRLTIPVASVKHADKRVNIPTEELRDFVAEDAKAPKPMLYPRDPSLDPQLVWKGKDEQDAKPLEVPVVPIYIQEKIHPQAIVQQVKAASKKEAPDQAELFSDFNGITFEDQIEFYQHEQNWSNRMILGDSLFVMTSLAEKERLKGKVQCVYFDPPYGIKFGSNWQVSTRKRDVKEKAEDATRQPEQVKAFRDTWQMGIHSYLTYLRDRLVLARDLLSESGSVFVQIGDENLHLVRSLLDEVFGSDNFFGLVTFKKTLPLGSSGLPAIADYILWYAKSKDTVKFRQVFENKPVGEGTGYTWIELEEGQRRKLSDSESQKLGSLSEGCRLFFASALASSGYTPSCYYDFSFEGRTFKSLAKSWRTKPEGMERLIKANRIIAPASLPCYIAYHTDFPVQPLHNLWNDTHGAIEMKYVVETSRKVSERCLLMATDPGDLVLDPTCGSGTTAYVAEQWGRRWITIDTSRVALALARTRLMAAKYSFYILADSAEGFRKQQELTGFIGDTSATHGNDIKKGFVCKRVPHVMLEAIAKNEEIDAIYARWQEKMEPVRKKINGLLKTKWEEWEIPRRESFGNAELGATSGEVLKWSDESKKLLAEWWKMRIARQREIDDSIARGADTEFLYDQPYEDNKRIRVAGPFTVESLSPHRMISASQDCPASETAAKEQDGAGQFESMIVSHLKAAGVQNTFKNERLKFERLEAFAGTYLQAVGEFKESGKIKRVAICIGPEHGTVGPDLIKDAAKEAVKGVGYNLLLVCGFAFDPHVSEEAKRYGELQVLICRMNPDLAMGDELLKKTGAGNLFMVFGEPDIELKKTADGNYTAVIKGLDVYDPTTGAIRSSTTDDIACWFIDTDYNGESFFVRHAYFTGAEEPYERLKKALRAEIDEGAWSALYSTKSQPFEKPSTKKIAVKVINHYGDEVLKVYDIK